jgi:Pyrimidine dimer DNA glycosylase
MRLWSLHPKYLDRQGLLACWREALLAQKVLAGGTRGYRNHPQLKRFLSQPYPLAAIASYLYSLVDEAEQRGYQFDRSKINPARQAVKIPVTRGQVIYEWEHLKAKLAHRDPARLTRISFIEMPEVHPLFDTVDGTVEPWEKIL